MIGNITFYPNLLWGDGYTKTTYPSITLASYTCSGGETTGALYDLTDGCRGNTVELDMLSLNPSDEPIIEIDTDTSNTYNFAAIDTSNGDNADAEIQLYYGTTALTITNGYHGNLGSEMISIAGGATAHLSDNIVLCLFSDTTYANWRLKLIAEDNVAGYSADITARMLSWGKKYEVTLAPDLPEFYGNFDGINLLTSKGGQKFSHKAYGQRKAWKLRWSYVDETNYNKIITVWETTEGPRYPFYIDLGENTSPTLYFVRFIENSLQSRKLANNAYEVSFIIESEV